MPRSALTQLAHVRKRVACYFRRPDRSVGVGEDRSFGPGDEATMGFPIGELMDETACHEFLVGLLQPDGLACPHCRDRDHLKVHRCDRAPILAYRCTACRHISTAFTRTLLRG